MSQHPFMPILGGLIGLAIGALGGYLSYTLINDPIEVIVQEPEIIKESLTAEEILSLCDEQIEDAIQNEKASLSNAHDRVTDLQAILDAREVELAGLKQKAKGDESATLGLARDDWERYQSIGRECDDCHSVGYEAERYAKGTRDQARAMVSRMSQKMAEPYDAARIDEATDDWLELARDRDLFVALFPHDHPDDTGGGL